MNNPSVKELAEALQAMLTMHDAMMSKTNHGASFYDAGTIKAMNDAPVQAKTALCNARNWPADFAHENGNYMNNCCMCGHSFIGYKRRFVCRVCATTSASDRTWREAIAAAVSVCKRPNAGLVDPDGGSPTPSELIANLAEEIARLAPPAPISGAIERSGESVGYLAEDGYFIASKEWVAKFGVVPRHASLFTHAAPAQRSQNDQIELETLQHGLRLAERRIKELEIMLKDANDKSN